DYPMRLRLARRLAQLAEPPQRLTQLMAADEPEIARLFLERDELFDEAELVFIIKTTGPEHHAVLARRPSLPAAACDALIQTGEQAIIETLLVNPGTELKVGTYQTLAQLSRGNAVYQELLLARADFPASIAHEMFWHVGPPLRRIILQRYSME